MAFILYLILIAFHHSNGLQIDAPEQLNQLSIKNISTQISSTEAPADVPGNNLNVGVTTQSTNEERFQAISTTSFFKRKKSNDVTKENDKSLFNNKNERFGVIKPLALVWDSCMETSFKENREDVIRQQDIEVAAKDFGIENRRESGNSWNKRNVKSVNNTAAINAWIEKYNNLLNTKLNERRQRPESVFIKKITSSVETVISTTSPSTLSTSSTSTFPVIPITREIFKYPTEPSNTTDNEVTDDNAIASYTEDWLDVKNKAKIRFNSLPQRTTYLIPTLNLNDGFHPFSFMSEFFYFIHPFDFPIGLIKDIVWGEFTLPYSFIQAIKVESTFLAFIVMFACIALVIPCYLLIISILSLFSKLRSDDELETGALFPDAEDSKCNDRVLIATTFFVTLVCCVLIAGMTGSNEQAYSAASSAQNVVNCACADIAAWLSAAARELHHSLVPPVDLVLHAFKEDLKNVETLLGEPIQQAIASESGIDLVFDSLVDIIEESEDISIKISSLRDVSVRAGVLASAASDRIRDLAKQLESLRKHCTVKDMPLCDTINTNSLELKMKFDLILQEQQLLQLRTLGVDNMTRAISTAKKEFKALPNAIVLQTTQVRNNIIKDIERRKDAVHNSVKILSDIVRHLTAGLHTAARRLNTSLERVLKYDFARWTVMLACIITLSFVTVLILMALLCGCGHAKNHARRTLKVSAVWICLASLILWGMISAIFLIAGHAEIYVCHALWDSPQYQTLTDLLDKPSPLLTNNEGIFDALFKDMDNVTIDVSIKDVLRDCENDQPAYIVFQLDKILDVNKETSYFEWGELQADLGSLSSTVDVTLLKTISNNFNSLLNKMLLVTDVNFTKYRMDYNYPVVSRDLPSLVDQLENIAAQVTDLTTAGRLETLASRTERLHQTNIKPLEQLRGEVVFKITELELQLMPFRKKLNISLSHIHTAQYYIDNQSDVIARKKISLFMSRLISHAAGWRTHVLTSVGKHAARCRPLFTVFDAARKLICINYIASLHGWWVCGFLVGVLWCTALTPLCVKLWRTFAKKLRAQDALALASLGGQQETPTTAICDASNWNTPCPPAPPPRSDSW